MKVGISPTSVHDVKDLREAARWMIERTAAARRAGLRIAVPSLSLQQARAQADLYRERCAAYDRRPTTIALRRDIYVGESPAEAKAVLDHAMAEGYRGIAHEAVVAGSIDEVTERFRALGALGLAVARRRNEHPNDPDDLGHRLPPDTSRRAAPPAGRRGVNRWLRGNFATWRQLQTTRS